MKEPKGTENWYRKKRKTCAKCIATTTLVAFVLVVGALLYQMAIQG